MKLRSIVVGNFKNVAETTIELDKLAGIVSTNNYGKSNLLDAIRFGFDFIGASARERNRLMRSKDLIPLNSSLHGKDYRFVVEFEDDTLGCEYRYVRYGFSFTWGKDDGGSYITDEIIDMKKTASGKYAGYLKRNEGTYRSSFTSNSPRRIRLAKDVLAVDILFGIDDTDIAKAALSIRNLNCKMCSSLDLNSAFGSRSSDFTNPSPEMIPFDDFDVPKSLGMLRDEHPDKYRLFLDIIYEIFPEFDRIELNKLVSEDKSLNGEGKFYQVALGGSELSQTDLHEVAHSFLHYSKNDSHNLMVKSKYFDESLDVEKMSMGTKRIIWLVANVVFGECYGYNLIGVEEVETSIHPKLMKTLLESLVGCMESTAMIFTSHSPYIIQYLNPGHIYVGVPNGEGVAVFKKIKKSKERLLIKTADDLETSVAEYLFDLMAGGDRSAKILSMYLED